MSKQETHTIEEPTPAAQEFQMLCFYIKDLSFESPQAPQIFQTNHMPAIQLLPEVRHHKIKEDHYEVVLRLHIEAKTDNTPDASIVFLIEAHQAGLFKIAGLTEGQLQHALESVAPTILFPYVRHLVSTLTSQGNFPALNLPHIDFERLFMEKFHKEQKAMA